MDGPILDITAPYRRRTAAALRRWAAEAGLPPGFDPDLFGASVPRVPAPWDIVVDAGLAYARTAASLGRSPLDLARLIARDLAAEPSAASVEVAGPGFVNVTLTRAALSEALASILRAGFTAAAPPAVGRSIMSPDEARSIVTAEQVAALCAAAGRPVPPRDAGRGSRPILGSVVVRGGAVGIPGEAFRFAVASRPPNATLHIDPVALAERSQHNPAFWIPYAHARFRGLLRGAAAAMPDIDLRPPALAGTALSGLDDPGEVALARLLVRHAPVVSAAAAARAPQRLFGHLCDLATAIHSQWNRSKGQPQLRFVNEEEREFIKARLGLVTASTLVLNAGLGILGATAPDEMP